MLIIEIMAIIPFGKYKGEQINDVDPVYILSLLGYKERYCYNGNCIIPKDRPGWVNRYPEFYIKILNSITKCLRCDNQLNKDNNNKHLDILCNDCYNKHKNNDTFIKTPKEREFVNKQAKLTRDNNNNKINDIVNNFGCKPINVKFTQTEWCVPETSCIKCNIDKYVPIEIRKKYYNICEKCYNTEKLNTIVRQQEFDEDLYNNFISELRQNIKQLKFNDASSRVITNEITNLCIDVAKSLNFQYVKEKLNNCPDILQNIAYDIELTKDKTKFIIEIDREHNIKTSTKLRYKPYKKAIWIRWGKMTKDDVENDNYNLIKIEMISKNKRWSTYNRDITKLI